MFLPAAQVAAPASPVVIAAPANGAQQAAPAVCVRKQIKQKAKPIHLKVHPGLPDPFLPNAKPKPKKEQDVDVVPEAMAIAGSMEGNC